MYQALVLGTRDYIRKCGFSKVLIGLSGGIDSALTAADRGGGGGKENVTGVGMPGPYSLRSQRDGTRGKWRKGSGSGSKSCRSRASYERFTQELEPAFRGQGSGCDRRKSAIAAARRHADGAFQ